MKKRHLLLIFSLAISGFLHGQSVGINPTGAAPDATAMLDVFSTNSGLLVPRMTLAQRNAITTPASSLLIFQTNSTPGYYYNAGTPATPNWVRLYTANEGWSILGNAGTNTTNNFIGTTDNVGLRVRTNNAFRFEFTNNGRLRSQDNGTAGQPTYSWMGTGGTTVGMFRPAANTLAFSTTSAERMRIMANGQVIVNGLAPFAGDVFTALAGGSDYAVVGAAVNGTGIYGEAIGNNANAFASILIKAGLQGGSLISVADATSNGRAGEFQQNRTSNTTQALFASNLHNGTNANAAAVWGQNANGIRGGVFLAGRQNDNTIGVNGQYNGGGTFDGIGVVGLSNASAGWGIGVLGQGNWYGVFAQGGFAGVGAKYFHIDHPLDPLNKSLRHANIESNEVLNHYRGNVQLDASGAAVVQLPDYFETININFSYHLTAIGAPAPNLHVSEEVSGNSFAIAGGSPGQKVSWTVQAERNDQYMQTYPEMRDMELNKKPYEVGKYYMPEIYGAPKEQGIFNFEQENETPSPTPESKKRAAEGNIQESNMSQ